MVKNVSREELLRENEELKARLDELEETLQAVRSGEVDALVVSTSRGDRVFTLEGADQSYRILIEGMREGAALLSDSGVVLYCNSGFANVVKKPIEKIVGNNIFDIVSPANVELFEEFLAGGGEGEDARQMEVTLQAQDGMLIPTLMSVTSLRKDDVKTTCLVVTDLTQHMKEELKKYTGNLEREIAERRKAEEALRISEEKANALVKYAPTGIYELEFSLPPKFRNVNDAMCSSLGYSREEMLKMNPMDLLDEEGRSLFKSRITKVLAGEKIDDNVEFKIRNKDGMIMFALLNSKFFFEEGKPVRALVIAHDVTERRKAEEALKQSEERFRALAQTSPIGVGVSSVNGVLLYTNPAYESILGYGCNELVGKKSRDLYLNPDERKSWLKTMGEDRSVRNVEIRLKKRDGTPVWVAINTSYIIYEGKQAVMGTIEDVTERRKAEEALRKSEWVARQRAEELEELQQRLEDKAAEVEEYATRMEELAEERAKKLQDAERLAAIGTTAGMVGHDIRNPLQAIVGDLYLAKSDLVTMPESQEKEGLQESLAEIEKNVEYIDKIVQDLQDFAKPFKPVAKEADLEEICNEVLFKNGIPENMDASCEVDENVKKVIADPELLKRILSNLVSNGFQAMPDGGKLEIKAFPDADDVVVTVEDTGVGIPEDIRPQLFTPLFTTKSRGQGFGLAVVKRMSEALGGSVTFKSEVGKGTKFIVRLPSAKKANNH
jgi:PAS domain S-box-containing protein